MRAIMVAGLAVMALSLPAGARAPLCRDSKGLFTPCVASSASRRPVSPRPAKSVAGTGADQREDRPQQAPAATRPKGPPALGHGRLCRDGKGLFTPCAG